MALIMIFPFLLAFATAQQCGRQAGGRTCPNNLCYSQYGYCGTTDDYCSPSKIFRCNCHSSGGRGGGGGNASISAYCLTWDANKPLA
ncbi:hypothetical protein CsSME_00023576 [Camellia sinensis var. sinensis]